MECVASEPVDSIAAVYVLAPLSPCLAAGRSAVGVYVRNGLVVEERAVAVTEAEVMSLMVCDADLALSCDITLIYCLNSENVCVFVDGLELFLSNSKYTNQMILGVMI